MKKLLIAICGFLVLSACTRDGEERISWCLRIVNNTDCTLNFSNIDCEGPNKGYGDYTFYPEKSFTIEPPPLLLPPALLQALIHPPIWRFLWTSWRPVCPLKCRVLVDRLGREARFCGN